MNLASNGNRQNEVKSHKMHFFFEFVFLGLFIDLFYKSKTENVVSPMGNYNYTSKLCKYDD